MPRQNPITPGEGAICERVRLVREATKLSRVAFSVMLQVDSSELSRVEHRRAPLRYWLGRTICERFDINQRWLATGSLPKKLYLDVTPFVESKIQPRDLFSAVYDGALKQHVEERLKTIAGWHACAVAELDNVVGEPPAMPAIGTQPHEALLFHMVKVVQYDYWRLPGDLHQEFADEIIRAATAFVDDHAAQIEAARTKAKKK